MTVIFGSIIFGFFVGILATILAACAVGREPGHPSSETPIYDSITPSPVVIAAEALTRRAASDAEWEAIKAATDGRDWA